MNMDPNSWHQQLVHFQHSITQLTQNITALKAHLGVLDVPVRLKETTIACICTSILDAVDAGNLEPCCWSLYVFILAQIFVAHPDSLLDCSERRLTDSDN